ncbi:hypothetical protein Rmf_26610 [Roseomonas fluvialis]|uniref:Uncharacterized protein n=1 Tax=Roseomonas fluvialis TaxID=1750527 RepID=A0ABN6P4Z3_9PROT|nr:hypothetical protein Rmf_26610 [Roseomonas fluvialis]
MIRTGPCGQGDWASAGRANAAAGRANSRRRLAVMGDSCRGAAWAFGLVPGGIRTAAAAGGVPR